MSTEANTGDTTTKADNFVDKLKKDINTPLGTLLGTNKALLKKVAVEFLRLAVDASVEDPDSIVIREALEPCVFENRFKSKDDENVKSMNAIILAFLRYVNDKYGLAFGGLLARGDWVPRLYQIVYHFVDALREKSSETTKLEASEVVWTMSVTRLMGSPFLEDAKVTINDVIEKDQESRDTKKK